MTIRDATLSAPKPSRRPAARRRSVESDDGSGGRARSSVERVPPDDREREEIGPQAGYGGSVPEQTDGEH